MRFRERLRWTRGRSPRDRGTAGRDPVQLYQPSTPRTLSRRLARQRDEILAPLADPGVSLRRFDIVGDVGSGKSALLQDVAEHCRAHGLLVLDVDAPRPTPAADSSAQSRELADLHALSDLIAGFIGKIAAFSAQHPESRAAASRAIGELGRARNPQRLHNLVLNAKTEVTVAGSTNARNIGNVTIDAGHALAEMRFAMLREETESALLSLAHKHPLAILIDDVHVLDATPLHTWLRALLTRIPTQCTVTARRPGGASWLPGHTDEEQTLELQDMTFEEVGEYLRGRQLSFTDDEARELFDRTGGHGYAVATWCDLALEGSGVGGIAELMDSAEQAADVGGFTNLIERLQQAVDQIPVDVAGRRLPLFALLTVARTVTPELIAMLESETGDTPSTRETLELYRRLASRRFISAVDGDVEKGVYLSRAISDAAWRQLLEKDPVTFRKMHSYAESHYRKLVDLDYELNEETPFAAWSRFEDPAWVRGVERWLSHAKWLDHQQFERMKPALVKIYLDAFWWWDDYLRSAATSRLGPALKSVALQQQDELWMNALTRFSDNYVSSWDEAELRSDPGRWRAVQDAIIALFNMFDLQRGRIPRDPALRRIYILLCNFHGKASWYAGEVSAQYADEADEWLAAAAVACTTQSGEDEAANPNGWIGSWAALRRAEIWSTLNPPRSHGYLDGLDKQAIEDGDGDLRVGIATLIGDLRWQDAEHSLAFDAYSRAILISYAYNARQELKRQAPNLYTKALYAATTGRVADRAAELERAGNLGTLEVALDRMRQLFEPYWARVRHRPDPPPELPRHALPVPPPDVDEISTLESEYVQDLEHLALRKESRIHETSDLPLGG